MYVYFVQSLIPDLPVCTDNKMAKKGFDLFNTMLKMAVTDPKTFFSCPKPCTKVRTENAWKEHGRSMVYSLL